MKVSNVRRTEDEPHDPLTELADRMLHEMRMTKPGLQAVVMLREASNEGRAALAYDGFEDDTEAFAYMLVHLKAMALARGSDLVVVPLNRG